MRKVNIRKLIKLCLASVLLFTIVQENRLILLAEEINEVIQEKVKIHYHVDEHGYFEGTDEEGNSIQVDHLIVEENKGELLQNIAEAFGISGYVIKGYYSDSAYTNKIQPTEIQADADMDIYVAMRKDINSLSVEEGERIGLYCEDTMQLHITSEPIEVENKELIFVVEDTNVATINEEGLVTAVNPGTTKATISYLEEESIFVEVEIVVSEDPSRIQSLSFLEEKVEVNLVDKEYKQIPTILPDTASSAELIWISSDESIATVNEEGLVILNQAGVCNITVQSARDNEIKAQYELTILGENQVKILLNGGISEKIEGEEIFLNGNLFTEEYTLEDVIQEYQIKYQEEGKLLKGARLNGAEVQAIKEIQLENIKEDVEVVLEWVDGLALHFEAKEGSFNDGENSKVVYILPEESYILSQMEEPSNPKGEFLGWSIEEYKENIVSEYVEGKSTYYAVYDTEAQLTLHTEVGYFIKANNQSMAIDGEGIIKMKDLPLPSVDDRYTFEGWYHDEACTKKVEEEEIEIKHTSHIYAKHELPIKEIHISNLFIPKSPLEIFTFTTEVKGQSEEASIVIEDEYWLNQENQQMIHEEDKSKPNVNHKYIYHAILKAENGYVFKENVQISINGEAISSDEYTLTIQEDGRAELIWFKEAKVEAIDISKANVQNLRAMTYTGSAIELKPLVILNARILKEGEDYQLSYQNNVEVGVVTVTIQGIGNYTGTITRYFSIIGINLNRASVSGVYNKQYTGRMTSQDPIVLLNGEVLRKDEDYILEYEDNIEIGKAKVIIKGKGHYSGNIEMSYSINYVLSSTNTQVSGIYNKTYNRLKAQTQKATLVANNKVLKEGVDYSVSYQNNINVGTATVTFTGIGYYSGSITKTFKISSAISLTPTNATVGVLDVGKYKSTLQMKASVSSNQSTLTWSSSDPSIATVNSYGLVRGIRDPRHLATSVTITATTSDGIKAASMVTVEHPVSAFVRRLYRYCLFRNPDASGFNFWTSRLNNQTDVAATAVQGFFESNEMINLHTSDDDFINRCYKVLLDRNPEAKGKAYWLKRLSNGESRRIILQGFVMSNEFSKICFDFGIRRGNIDFTKPNRG